MPIWVYVVPVLVVASLAAFAVYEMVTGVRWLPPRGYTYRVVTQDRVRRTMSGEWYPVTIVRRESDGRVYTVSAHDVLALEVGQCFEMRFIPSQFQIEQVVKDESPLGA